MKKEKFLYRRERDSNPRYGIAIRRISNALPSASRSSPPKFFITIPTEAIVSKKLEESKFKKCQSKSQKKFSLQILQV